MKFHVWLIISIVVYLAVGSLVDSTHKKPTAGQPATVLVQSQSEATRDRRDNTKVDINYKLFVKGEDIAVGNHVLFDLEHDYAELPLTAIVKALGAKVEWKNETTATIEFDDKNYILNVADNSLVETGTTFNILIPAPGSKHAAFHQMIEDEFVVDSDSIKLLLHYIGATIKIDYDALSIYID